MKKVSSTKIIEIAQSYSKTGVSWHHHFFTPSCLFNKENNFLIVLENENTGVIYASSSHTKPLSALKKLERLFFKHS